MTSIDRSQPSYFSKYRNVRFERSEDGILVMSLHNDGRPLTSRRRTTSRSSTPSTTSRAIAATRSSFSRVPAATSCEHRLQLVRERLRSRRLVEGA